MPGTWVSRLPQALSVRQLCKERLEVFLGVVLSLIFFPGVLLSCLPCPGLLRHAGSAATGMGKKILSFWHTVLESDCWFDRAVISTGNPLTSAACRADRKPGLTLLWWVESAWQVLRGVPRAAWHLLTVNTHKNLRLHHSQMTAGNSAVCYSPGAVTLSLCLVLLSRI